MKIAVYNQQGEKIKELTLDPEIFEIKTKPWLIQEAVEAQLANARVNVAKTKDRSEVRGGGRKPWRQKGTGRARQGSIRSPLWRGGGVTFGPLNIRNFSIRINSKIKRQALLMSLSEKAAKEALVVMDTLDLPAIKTKQLVSIFKNLKINGRKLLLSLPEKNELVMKSARQIKSLRLIAANSLNIRDVLWADTIITTEDGVKTIAKTYGHSE